VNGVDGGLQTCAPPPLKQLSLQKVALRICAIELAEITRSKSFIQIYIPTSRDRTMAYLIPRLLKQRSEGLARQIFKTDGYNRYGLYHDDIIGGCYNNVDPAVAEAQRRLIIDQPDLHDQRVYRSLRANQLYIQKKTLPQEEWVSFEEDMTKGRYLQPYLAQIAQEEEERKAIMSEE